MLRGVLLLLLLLLLRLAHATPPPPPAFDARMANATVVLSAYAYCSNATIVAGGFPAGGVDDFVTTNVVYNRYYDVHGYVGYSERLRAVFVVFRGSLSIKNWLDDFDTLMTSFPLCTGCDVHRGFYFAAQSVRDDVVAWAQALQARFPAFDVVVTGHSLGGALATLVAAELARPAAPPHGPDPDPAPTGLADEVQQGLDAVYGRVDSATSGGGGGGGLRNVRHVSFGSPRVANGAAARYLSALLPTNTTPPRAIRMTHFRDIVPHNPFTTLGYSHITGEWYEDEAGALRACEGYEDPHCADQWTFDETIADHLHYLQQQMWCPAPEDASAHAPPAAAIADHSRHRRRMR